MDTHMPMAFMERDLLMLSQRLMPTTMVMLDLMLMDTDHMDTQLMVMVTTERDLLMLSQRLRLMLTMVFMDTTERDLLMLSQRLMPTTDTLVMLDLMLMDT